MYIVHLAVVQIYFYIPKALTIKLPCIFDKKYKKMMSIAQQETMNHMRKI